MNPKRVADAFGVGSDGLDSAEYERQGAFDRAVEARTGCLFGADDAEDTHDIEHATHQD